MSTPTRDELLAVVHDPAAPLAVRQWYADLLGLRERDRPADLLTDDDAPIDLWPAEPEPTPARVHGATNPALGWVLIVVAGALAGMAGGLVAWVATR